MAYIKKMEGKEYTHIYNVDMAVGMLKQGYTNPDGVSKVYGKPQPNKKDDVLLVQYLLKRVYQKANDIKPLSKGAAAKPALLELDGQWGSKTQGAIEQYQLEMRRDGNMIAVDGCVDSDKSEFSSISGTNYTIRWLNQHFRESYPAFGLQIHKDPDCPALLKQKLAAGY